jgi:hypothetical protein
MGKGGPRSKGELLITFFLVVNIVLVVLILITDTHCQKQRDDYATLTATSTPTKEEADADQCEDIFFFSNERSDTTAAGLKDLNHHNGRAALVLTTLSGGVYVVMLIRQLLRLVAGEERVYLGRISIVVESFTALLLSLTSWALIVSEGGNLSDIEATAPATGTLDYSASTAWWFLLLIWLMNLFIFIRTTLLAYKPASWPDAIGAKGSFGSGGSARIAEQYPVMGGA